MNSQTRDAHTIEIVIAPDGTIEGEIKGLVGPSCEGILDDLIATEGEIISHKRTREYRLRPGQTVRHLNQAGR